MEVAEREVEMERYKAMKAARIAARRAESAFKDPEGIVAEHDEIAALREQVCQAPLRCVCSYDYWCMLWSVVVATPCAYGCLARRRPEGCGCGIM